MILPGSLWQSPQAGCNICQKERLVAERGIVRGSLYILIDTSLGTILQMTRQYAFDRQIGCGNWASVWVVKRGTAVKAMKVVHRSSQSGALQRFDALINEYKVRRHGRKDCIIHWLTLSLPRPYRYCKQSIPAKDGTTTSSNSRICY